MANFYLGSASDLASNMGSMFGSGNTQGTWTQPNNPMSIVNATATNPVSGVGPTRPVDPKNGFGGKIQQPQPPMGTGATTGATSGPYPSLGFDPLAAQAIRPTTFGQFDPAYGQNLSTFIGNTFQRPQQNQALQFNPYGNLTDANVQYPNMGGGNAPTPGLPQSLLQFAQWFNPTALGTNNG